MRALFASGLILAAIVSPAGAASWSLTGSTGAHDPTIIKEGNTWWCFATGTGLPVKFSLDGVQWNQGVRLFDVELPWWRTYAPRMGQLDVWAPDIQKFGDRFWCFYAVSEFGQNNSAIGLKSCTSIAAADWRDDGLVISSRAGDSYNAIDPHLSTDAEGNPWLAFGSWFAGIQVIRLDPATMKLTGARQTIAQRPNGIEGANIVYANGYYYLFVSIDVCCQGVNSTYKIAYGRSRSVTGPYVDKNNVALLNAGGTLLEVGAGRWIGPGGQDVYRDGNAWIIARHAYDGNNNGRATLLISDLYWDSSLWPTFTDPSGSQNAAPVITADPVSQAVNAGTGVTLSVGASDTSPVTYEWLKDGFAVTGATNALLNLPDVQLRDVGIYAALAKGAATSASAPAIVGLATTSKTFGAGAEIGSDIVHLNGNVYDQVLLQGATASITADPGQVTRISYLDLSNDIVQVEFSGAGTLTIALENSSGPAAAVNYNQPGVAYMKGHARIVIVGANETTNVSIFSVGRATAVNQALFRDDVAYDGWANVASIAILSSNGRFGGVRTANAIYSAPNGLTGIFAPGVKFDGPVFIGGISAIDAATPVLFLGSVGDARVTGGDLSQANGRPVSVSGLSQLRFVAGTSSHGALQPARANQGRLQQDGNDVTNQIVVNPGP